MFRNKKLFTLGASFGIVILSVVTLLQSPWIPVALGQSDDPFSVFLPALGSGGESAQSGLEIHLGDQTTESGTLSDLASLFTDGHIAISTDSPTAITLDFIEDDVVTAQVHLCIKETCDSALGATTDSSASDEVASLFSSRGIVVTQEQPGKITFAASNSHATTESRKWHQVTLQCKQANCEVVNSLHRPNYQRGLRIDSFTLVNANTNEDLNALGNSVTLDLAALPPFNVRTNVSSASRGVGSVKFIVNGALQSIENAAPYSLAGDNQGDYAAWSPQPGLYRIRAVPYTRANGLGQRGREKTIFLNIVDNNSTEPTATNTPVPTATNTPVGTATNTPVETATNTPVPTATNTPMTHDHEDMFWHAPGAHGDRPSHEHGDAPPQWVLDAGYTPSFTHDMGTPNENMAYWKHTSFKGYGGNFKGVDWYGVFHLDFNPSGHPSRFHSYQMWLRDGSGNVSHMSGWLDFGQDDNTGPNVDGSCSDTDRRPHMSPIDQGCPVGANFESWYAREISWSIDFGFNIATNYYTGGDPNDPTTWTPIEGNKVRNLLRRIEFAWYADRSTVRGEFWATQWGDIVSGPNDPLCGTQRSYGTRSYTVLCVRQYIAPTLPTIAFPGNSVQREFPGAGVVQLPN